VLELILTLMALLGYDHPKFEMGPAHHKLRCGACHRTTPPDPACETCHAQRSRHAMRFSLFACADCHSSGSQRWAPVNKFDHETKTKFRRDWMHRELGCRECHRGSSPSDFENLSAAVGTCTGCHTHVGVHDGKFVERQCINCHLPTGPGGSQP